MSEQQQHIEPVKKSKTNWTKMLKSALWLVIGCGVLTLLVAAATKNGAKTCKRIEVQISGDNKNIFVDEAAVKRIINSSSNVVGKELAAINLRALEEKLNKDPWILRADLFFDNKDVLNVHITEREPVARVFTMQGSSFYVDKTGLRLPLSEKLYAVVPVFTGFTNDKKILPKTDSALLGQIVSLGSFIVADSFWNAQIGQIDIALPNNFNMIPVIGNHVIEFGDTTNMVNKFQKLFKFYKATYPSSAYEKYEKLNVKYDGQVVAVKRGAAKPAADSARALEAFEGSARRMEIIMRDTSTVKMDTTNIH